MAADHALPATFNKLGLNQIFQYRSTYRPQRRLSEVSLTSRKHDLVKTFWARSSGWHDQQLPHGTIIWTSPKAKTYTTRRGAGCCSQPCACLWTNYPSSQGHIDHHPVIA